MILKLTPFSDSTSTVILVLDGYQNSTKDLEHASRQKYSCATHAVDRDKKIPVSQKKFFSNSTNKENLIGFLIHWLENSLIFQGVGFSLTMRKGQRDADTLVVKSAREECEKSAGPVAVHGTDTDLLMLMLFHCHSYKNIFYNKINVSDVWELMSDAERKVFLVAYCFTGVDTVSSIFGKGKASLLELFSSNGEIRDVIVPAFLDPNSSMDKIDELGVRLMRIIYGKTADVTLTKMRVDAYNKQCVSGKIKPERLPPTEDAALFHGRRAFQQCREWVLLDPDLTDTPFGWCWDGDMAMYLPVYTTRPVAPRELESFVSCNCHGTCSKNICTCFQNRVKCLPSVCGHCSAEGNCQNLDDIEIEDPDEMELGDSDE